MEVARESAEAARTSAEAARSAASVQMTAERAWMAQLGVELASFAPGTCTQKVMVHVSWQNVGKTPAFDCKIRGEFQVVPNSALVPVFIPRDDDGTSRSAPLMPGIKAGGPIRSIDLDAALSVVNKQNKLYVWGRADYKDVFGNERFSEACFDVVFGPGDELIKKNGNVQVHPWAMGPQNGAS